MELAHLIRSRQGYPLCIRKRVSAIRGCPDPQNGGIVIGWSTYKRTTRRALMGSVSDSVVRHAHCPVIVVRQEE